VLASGNNSVSVMLDALAHPLSSAITGLDDVGDTPQLQTIGGFDLDAIETVVANRP
jgi:hypothetical protein